MKRWAQIRVENFGRDHLVIRSTDPKVITWLISKIRERDPASDYSETKDIDGITYQISVDVPSQKAIEIEKAIFRLLANSGWEPMSSNEFKKVMDV